MVLLIPDAVRQLIEKGRQQGLQEGRQEGRQQGLRESRQEGRQKGYLEGRQEVRREWVAWLARLNQA